MRQKPVVYLPPESAPEQKLGIPGPSLQGPQKVRAALEFFETPHPVNLQICGTYQICVKFAAASKMKCVKIDAIQAAYTIAVKINYIFLAETDNPWAVKTAKNRAQLLTNYEKVL